MIELPRSLSPWAEQLEGLELDVALTVGAWLPRIDALVGPLHSHPRDDGDPDGFDGLTRRGHYERLMMSEWLLADVAPDEFVRRAATGEHLFLQLGERSPASAERCLVLFDAGWQQVGDPRLAHIALLIALARRAHAAGVSLCWGIVQTPGHLRDGVSKPGIRALINARTHLSVTAEQLARWWDVLSPTAGDDVWLIGGSELTALAKQRRAAQIEVRQSAQPGPRQLQLDALDRQRRPRRAVLELPAEDAAIRVLRHPFGAPPRQLDASRKPGIARQNALVFITGPRRLIGYGTQYSLVAPYIPASPHDKIGRTRHFDAPPGRRVVAAGYLSKNIAAVTLRDDILFLHDPRSHGACELRPEGDNRFIAPERVDSLAPLLFSRSGYAITFALLDGAGTLFVLPQSVDQAVGGSLVYEPRLRNVVAMDSNHGSFALVHDGADLKVSALTHAWHAAADWTPEPIAATGFTDRALFGHTSIGIEPYLVAIDFGDYWQLCCGSSRYHVARPTGQVIGAFSGSGKPPGLVVLADQGSVLLHVSTNRTRPITRLERPATSATMTGSVVAWVDGDGYVDAWCLNRGQNLYGVGGRI